MLKKSLLIAVSLIISGFAYANCCSQSAEEGSVDSTEAEEVVEHGADSSEEASHE